jgi:hypothetical protein
MWEKSHFAGIIQRRFDVAGAVKPCLIGKIRRVGEIRYP